MKKILFRPSVPWAKETTDSPTPMSSMVPKWYRDLSIYIKGVENKRIIGKTVKTCVPVLDSMISGYALRLPVDVNTFIDGNGNRRFTWHLTDFEPIETHSSQQMGDYPFPAEYENEPFKFVNVWGLQAPTGYSLMFCHPFGRFDLPFYSMHGIVDSDLHYVPMHIPFVMKKEFEGVIEKGTIFAQVIPIKRENWQSEVRDLSEFDASMVVRKTLFYVEKWYKNFVWQKKEYKQGGN